MPGSEIPTVSPLFTAQNLAAAFTASPLFVLRPDHNYFDLELSVTPKGASAIEYQEQVSNDGGTTWLTPMIETVSADGIATAAKYTGRIALADLAAGATDTVVIPFLRESYGNYRFRFRAVGGGATLTATIRKFGNRPPAWALKFGAGVGTANSTATATAVNVLDASGRQHTPMSETTGLLILEELRRDPLAAPAMLDRTGGEAIAEIVALRRMLSAWSGGLLLQETTGQALLSVAKTLAAAVNALLARTRDLENAIDQAALSVRAQLISNGQFAAELAGELPQREGLTGGL